MLHQRRKPPHLLRFFTPIILSCLAAAAISYGLLQTTRTSHKPIPRIGNRVEYCLVCHEAVRGFSAAHDPGSIGCSSCHLGNPEATEKEAAHEQMVNIPGNLAGVEQSCGQAECHQSISHNIQRSMMASGRGLVNVNRWAFGEADQPDSTAHLSHLGDSPADLHLRQLCASCHLNRPKKTFGALDTLSRGGGCLACHLQYSPEAEQQLKDYQNGQELPQLHPRLTLQMDNKPCFGCHSRSTRISTSYEGWQEMEIDADTSGLRIRKLPDGRFFRYVSADVHTQGGMICIDCHTWRETMGDGQAYLRQEQQLEIACQDCHRETAAETVGWSGLSEIDQKILSIRDWIKKPLNFVRAQKTGNPLLNVVIDSLGVLRVRSKTTGALLTPKAPSPRCGRNIRGHKRLNCQSCHTAWAPQCVSCHTEYEPQKMAIDHVTGEKLSGGWVEYSGDFYADPPVLGVRESSQTIETFVPGMILTISGHQRIRLNPALPDTLFRRLYAPVKAHTTMHKGRECQTCHWDPLALGLGRGNFSLQKNPSPAKAMISFSPLYANRPEDGLPYDAWTGLFQDRLDRASSWEDVRPFNRAEQFAILRVGVCLACHASDNPAMNKIFGDFKRSLQNRTPTCLDLQSY